MYQVRIRAIAKVFLLTAFISAICVVMIVRRNPQIFNESFMSHAHCIKMLDGALAMYAEGNSGRYPFHTNGFGDALLLLGPMVPLSGPHFSEDGFENARRLNLNVDERECGRVYVQGLSRSNDSRIAIAFDKVATAGGDHSHFWHKLKAPLGREVLYVDGVNAGGEAKYDSFVLESDWPNFSKEQIELLVQAGIRREIAEGYYRTD